ncbi:alkaline phosphatase [Sphingobacterium sp. LRF_L2]|uniref:alkaline phosphatase n=1 Tax=Sphingobacterium sp. LRF_L2 TaxID=3369421 RepID=UPI003F633088
MKEILYTLTFFATCCGSLALQAQEIVDMRHHFEQLMFSGKKIQQHSMRGHSHNDYEQEVPFFTAYSAGMESIEIDLFLHNDSLYAAHEKSNIRSGRTLEELYLKPLAMKFRSNEGRPFADSLKTLQLLLDLKEDYRRLMPPLLSLLERYRFMLDPLQTPHPVRIVISGNMPEPSEFSKFPSWVYFDGRPTIDYTHEQIKHVGMISEDLHTYTDWNGKGVPPRRDMQKIMQDSKRAKDLGISFRLWGTPESVNTWIVLEKMGVSWLNTDKPVELKLYLDDLVSARFQLSKEYPVYHPTYLSDGENDEVRNVILLIGDGMGLGHIQAALAVNKGKSNMGMMRHIGFSFTSSYSPGNTDSGAGGTAIATGVKTFNGMLSVDTVGNPLAAIPSKIVSLGMHSGIISTGDASDATPAAFYTSHLDRNASEEISASLQHNKTIDILVGGKPSVYQNAQKWKALEVGLRKNGFTLLREKNDFLKSTEKKIVVYLPDSTLKPIKDGRGPILSELLLSTVNKLKNRGKGFFVMAESAQIDYGGHARDLTYVTSETLDFDQAVGDALRFADQDGHTLVIVVADHETGALTLLDVDSNQQTIQGNFASNDHSSMLVPVMAYGPGARHFSGFYQNTVIFDRIINLLERSKR